MYEYDATIIEVIDADTFSASVDLGFYTYCRQHFRLLDYYAPEIRGVQASLGIIGKAKLEEYLKVGNIIRIKTEKADSFGRWLADVQHEGASLSKILSDQGYGVLRPGKKKGEKINFDPAQPYPLTENK